YQASWHQFLFLTTRPPRIILLGIGCASWAIDAAKVAQVIGSKQRKKAERTDGCGPAITIFLRSLPGHPRSHARPAQSPSVLAGSGDGERGAAAGAAAAALASFRSYRQLRRGRLLEFAARHVRRQ